MQRIGKAGLLTVALTALYACGNDKPNVTINGPVTMVNQMNNIGPGVSPSQTNLVRGAESGKKQRFANYYFTEGNCINSSLPTIKILKQPSHGQLSIEEGDAYANYPKDHPHAVCNGQKVRAMVVYYTSEAGFVGTDSLSLEVIYSNGTFMHNDYTINVR